ncbi:MAG TPA: tripartite tricarboxylate transporter substrate binding protein [Dongiaceae bacterium]
MKVVCLALLALVPFIGSAHTQSALAQDAGWKPTRNTEIVVGNGAGGEIDRIARAVQRAAQVEHLTDANISVVNKPGTGQMIAVAYMNAHAGDGHYISILNRSWIAVQASKNTRAYQDVTPIEKAFSAYQIFAVNPDSPIKNPKDIIAKLKQDVSSVSFTFVARGGSEHASAVKLAELAGADPKKLKIVIFDNASKAALAVAGGHVDVYISSVGTAMPLIQGGKMRAIGIGAPERLKGPMASVPTLREQGVDLLSQQAYFFCGPKGMTKAQVAFWQDLLAKALQSDDVQKEALNESWVTDLQGSDQLGPWLAQTYDEVKAAQVAAGYEN